MAVVDPFALRVIVPPDPDEPGVFRLSSSDTIISGPTADFELTHPHPD